MFSSEYMINQNELTMFLYSNQGRPEVFRSFRLSFLQPDFHDSLWADKFYIHQM